MGGMLQALQCSSTSLHMYRHLTHPIQISQNSYPSVQPASYRTLPNVCITFYYLALAGCSHVAWEPRRRDGSSGSGDHLDR